jgi:nicotinamide-nucleotide adenylyltransferase
MKWTFSSDDIQRFRLIQHLLDRLDPDARPQAAIVPGSPVPEGDIIVFPGSFNPPTNAHLAMLRQAQQFEQLHGAGKVYAAVSKHTTDKEHVERPLLVDRLVLLETVLQQHAPGVGMMLFNRGLYVEQAEGIRTAFPAVRRLLFLVGFDKIVQIFDPHYYTDREAALRELFKLAEILVAPRADAGERELRALLEKPENRQYARFVHLLPLDASYRQVSSTHIRQDFAGHRQDVPPEVARFIEETGAYAAPERLPDGSQRDVYGERMEAIRAITSGSV